MRRIVVPLDGSRLSEAILPDARRLAGAGGDLILVYSVDRVVYGSASRQAMGRPPSMAGSISNERPSSFVLKDWRFAFTPSSQPILPWLSTRRPGCSRPT